MSVGSLVGTRPVWEVLLGSEQRLPHIGIKVACLSYNASIDKGKLYRETYAGEALEDRVSGPRLREQAGRMRPVWEVL